MTEENENVHESFTEENTEIMRKMFGDVEVVTSSDGENSEKFYKINHYSGIAVNKRFSNPFILTNQGFANITFYIKSNSLQGVYQLAVEKAAAEAGVLGVTEVNLYNILLDPPVMAENNMYGAAFGAVFPVKL